MSDLSRIKRNVAKMVDMGAPEQDIDQYIASEGVSLADVRNAPMQSGGVVQTATDFASKANDMLLGQWGDEYRAGMKTILPEALGGTGKSFDENLQFENARQRRIDTERPIVRVAGETAGLGAQMVTGAGLVKSLGGAAQTAGGRILQAAGLAGGQGAVEGAGQADFGNKTLGGIVGGTVGTVFGTGGAGIAEAAANRLARAGRTAQQNAADRVASRLSSDNVSAGGARDAMRQAHGVGSDEFSLVDAGGANTRRLARGVKNMGGEAAEVLDDFAERRVAGQHDRFTNAVSKNVGKQVDDIDGLKKQIHDFASRKTGPVYESLTDMVTLPRRTKTRMANSQSAKEAYQIAQRLASESGDEIQPIFVNGRFNPEVGEVSAKTLHYMRQGFDDLVEGQTNIKGDVTKLGQRMVSQRAEIDGLLKRSSPQIRDADALYSSLKKAATSLNDGQKYTGMEPGQLRAKLAKMDKRQRAMYRLGAAWKMFADLGQMNDGRDISKVFMASPKKRRQVELIMSDSKAYDKISKFVNAEKAVSKTNQALRGNSTTAEQLAEMESLSGVQKAYSKVTSPGRTFVDFVDNTIMKATGVTEAEKTAITEFLTSTDPKQLNELMSMISGAQARQTAGANAQMAITAGTGLAAGDQAREITE